MPPIDVEAAPLPARHDTANADVVDTDRADTGATAGDALREQTGVQLRSAGGRWRRMSLSLRGTDNQQALVLLGDVPLGPASGGGVDLALLGLLGVGRVELYRGAAPWFGAHAIGGAVRLVPDLEGPPAVHLGAGGGSWGRVAVEAAQRGRAGRTRWQAGWSLRHSDGDFPFVDARGVERVRTNNRVDALGGTLSVEVDAGRGWRTGLTALSSSAWRGEPGPEEFPSTTGRSRTAMHVVSLSAARDDDAGSWNLGAWTRIDEFAFRDPSPWLPPAVDHHTLDVAAGGSVRRSMTLGSVHLVEVLVDGSFETAAVRSNTFDASPHRTQLGAVLADSMALASGRVLVEPSLRVAWSDDFGLEWVPHAGVLWDAASWLTLRANAGRAWRLPSFQELTLRTNLLRGNPDLHPERAWSFDARADLTWSWARVSLGAFYLLIDNLILFLPKTAFLLEADDSKAARSRGFEVAVRLTPWRWLEVRGAWTLTDARFADTGRRLPARSPHIVHAALAVHPWTWASASVSAHWQSAFTLDRFEELREEARLFVGAAASFDLGRRVTLRLEVDNLTDVRTAQDTLQQPLPPRSAWISLRWDPRADADPSVVSTRRHEAGALGSSTSLTRR